MIKTKLTSLIYGTLVAGSLVLSVGPASARDWAKRDGRDYHRPVPTVPAPVYPAGRIPQRVWRYPVAPAYPPATIYGDPAYGYPVAAPAYSQDLYRQLENARRKKAYDVTHHASREQLAKDNARIVRLESQLGVR